MKRFSLVLLSSLWMTACGSNIFDAIDKDKPAEKAAALLDEQKPDEAIQVLEEALREDPSNAQLISLMASAKAQKAGVDTFDIAIKLASDGVSGDNALTALFSILPPVDLASRNLMQESVTLLSSIPADQRIEADNFKATLFNTAFSAMQAKFLDGDGDGQFSVEELNNLDEASANAIINSLLDAQNSAQVLSGAEENGVAAETVTKILQSVQNQPGANNAEKLKSYLEQSR